MVGAENRRPAVERVLVEPHHARGRHALEPVSQQYVVQHQPRQRRSAWKVCGHSGVAAGMPAVNRASCRSRQARSRRPRPRLRSAPRTTISPPSCSTRCAACFARPATPSHAAPGGPARVEVRADDLHRAAGEWQRRRDGHPALQHQRELERPGMGERQVGQDRVAPVAPRRAVPHRRGIAQVESERMRRLDDVGAPARADRKAPGGAPARASGGPGRHGGVAPIDLLGEDDERCIGVAAEPLDHFLQTAASDPHVPAQHHQLRHGGLARRWHQVEGDGLADVGAPSRESITPLDAGPGRDRERSGWMGRRRASRGDPEVEGQVSGPAVSWAKLGRPVGIPW